MENLTAYATTTDFCKLFESAPNLYLVLSPDLKIIAVSDAYLQATMTQREAILSRGIFEVFPDNPDDPAATGVGNLKASLKRVLQFKTPDAMAVQKYDIARPESEGGGFEERFWSPLNTPVLDENKEVQYIIHRVEDVTEFVRLKQQGKEQNKITEELKVRTEQMETEIFLRAQQVQETNQKLREAERVKNDFFANVSHELRTPLSLILAPLESILSCKYGGISSLQLPLLYTIHNNAIRLLQMVTGLLDFAKFEAGKMKAEREPLPISSLIFSVLHDFEPLMKEKKIKASCKLNTPELWVMMDHYLFERILFNLLSNAVKFTPPGGQIKVELKTDHDWLYITVQDTGIGISEADIPHLFQKFRQVEGSSTRRFEGTGLGLAMVKEFAELLGGSVSVESQPGRGSIFTVTCLAPATVAIPESKNQLSKPTVFLPHYSVAAMHNKSSIPEITAETALLKVLVCEDNEELAWYIVSLIRGLCQTQIARDGKEGLALVESWKPDLVISDVMMPEIDGIAVCTSIKSNPETSTITVVLLTALTHRDAMLKGWEAKADEYLFKPFHPDELVTRIRSLLANISERKRMADLMEQKNKELAYAQAEMEHKIMLEAYAHQLERSNKELEEFAYISSHDMKSPVSSLNGLISLMEIKKAVKEEYQDLFELVKSSTSQMQKTINALNDIIAFRKTLKMPKEKLGLRKVLEEVKIGIHQLITASNATISADFDLCPFIMFPLIHLKSILQNLLTNAIKFTREGEAPVITIQSGRQDHYAILVVKDQGMGINLALYKDKLFGLFQRFHPLQIGMGIGLHIVHSIVESYEGKILVDSEENKGATFTIYLSHAADQ